MSSISTANIFSYINEVENALFHQECIRASIDALKVKLDNLKQQDTEATNNINDILAKCEDFGLVKRTVKMAADERVQSLIASGLLSVAEVEKAPEVESVSVKKTRVSKKKKEEVSNEENEASSENHDVQSEVVHEEPVAEPVHESIHEESVVEPVHESSSEISKEVKADIEDESSVDTHQEESEDVAEPESTETLTRKVPSFLRRPSNS